MNFYEEKDDDGRAFIEADGTNMAVDINGPLGYLYAPAE